MSATSDVSRESWFVLADQAVVSGGNFFTNLILARALMPEQYGVFSLVLLFLYAVNTCHSSVVVYPLILRAAKSKAGDLSHTVRDALLLTALCAVPLAALCGVFAVIMKRPEIVASLVGAMLLWQLQETTRRALLASGRARSAILPDCAAYCGQALLLLDLHTASLAVILNVILVTSFVALVWQAILLRVPVRLRTGSPLTLRSTFKEYWQLGRPVLGGNAFNMLALQMPGWVLSTMAGSVSVASYQSLLNIVGVCNPVIFSANTAIIPAVARSASRGVAHARATALQVGVRYGALLLPCLGAAMIFPHAAMRLLYGATNPYLSLATLLPLFAVAYLLQYVATVIGAYEGGMSRPKTYLYVQGISTVGLALLLPVLVSRYGIRGAIMAALAFGVLRLALFTAYSSHADKQHVSVPAPQTNEVTAPAKTSIAVCLLTYKRPELLDATLHSLRRQTILAKPAFQVRVIVVDNDRELSGVSVIAEHMIAGLDIAYLANPHNGLARGRNIALEQGGASADFVVFIDDDEAAAPDWLEQLVQTARVTSADVVTGPVVPVFEQAAPWIRDGNFFGTAGRQTGTAVQHAATNNTLLRAAVAQSFRFDPQYDTTGGEDTDFFLRVRAAGHTIRWCDEAKVYETIPPSRSTQQWILERARSDASRFTRSYVALYPGPWPRAQRVMKSAAGYALAVATLPKALAGRKHFVRSLTYVWRASGTLSALRGERIHSYAAAKPQAAAAIAVVGQTPPPVNGQSLMIRDFVQGNYQSIRIHFVPMKFSRSTREIGKLDLRKPFVALSVILSIYRARFRDNARVLYYPPAGANLVPVLRDLLILSLCRPLFHATVFHFHAAGLSGIYAKLPRPLRPLFRLAYNNPDLSIFTTAATSSEARFLHSGATAIIPCGVADPGVTPKKDTGKPVILFAGILCEAKGVLVLLQAALLLRDRGLKFELHLMGAFRDAEFEARIHAFLHDHALGDCVRLRGILTGAAKEQAFRDATLFCFPSFYPAESFGVVLIEAMSFGLPIVATDWQGIPEVTGRGQGGTLLVPPRDAASLSNALAKLLLDEELRENFGVYNRQRYLKHYTLQQYRNALEQSLAAVAP